MDAKKILFLGLAVVCLSAIAIYFTLFVELKEPPSIIAVAATPTQPTFVPAVTNESVPPSVAAASPLLSVDVNRLNYNRESFKGASMPDRLNAMAARRQGHKFSAEQVAQALQSDSAWAPDRTAADKLNLNPEEKRDGREFIRVNPLTIEALMPGDELNLIIHQEKPDGPLRMVVDRVEDFNDGNVTWHGHLKDLADESQISLTRGENLIVGGVNISSRNYVVQIHGDIGWVANGFTLFKTTGETDAVIPPGEHKH
jgi:hypothetical protein